MKISVNKIKLFLILWYPLSNLTICYIFKGDMMNVFSVCISGVLVLLNYKKLLSKRINGGILFWIFITLLVSICRGKNSDIVSCVLYAVTCMVLIVDAEIDISKIRACVIKYWKMFFSMQILFFMVLFFYVSQYGFTAGWDTYVLQGPYLYPHTLAYILLMMMMVDCYIWMNSKTKISLLFIALCVGCIVLTAVRSVLVAVAIIVLYILYSLLDHRNFKKLLFCLLIGSIAVAVAYKIGLFEMVIHKTDLAIKNSSITNGRGDIILSSLKALNGKWLAIKCFFGVGMDALQVNNLINYGAAIHAHNDLIDIFVCYGIPNLILYLYLFWKFSKDNFIWYTLSLGVLVLFNGLFPYIDCIPILIYSKILFDKSDGSSFKYGVKCPKSIKK